MRQVLLFVVMALLVAACGNQSPEAGQAGEPASASAKTDDGKGVGEIRSVSLNNPLRPELVAQGKAIYELKCAACHKLTDQRVVGPGFKGVTERRKPEWIMNMILHTDAMLAEDPAARALLEECLTRMPNQNLSQEDARAVLEFLYANDSGQ